MNGDERLARIEKMLETMLRNDGHIWWIGGYVYGRTSNDDPFIILYPASDKLQEKVCRVYAHDFKKLPGFIETADVPGDTEANPNKAAARKRSIYHECPLFEVTTYDGKETQMGPEQRFGEVLRVARIGAGEALARQESGGKGVGETRPAQGQQSAAQQPTQERPAQPPPPEDPPDEAAVGKLELPDYRALALEAKTENEFDYAAYMVLRNGLYTAVSRITAVRQAIVIGWKPSPRSNAAMLAALEVYRDKRGEAEGRGEAKTPASQFAKQEAMNAYNEAING